MSAASDEKGEPAAPTTAAATPTTAATNAVADAPPAAARRSDISSSGVGPAPGAPPPPAVPRAPATRAIPPPPGARSGPIGAAVPPPSRPISPLTGKLAGKSLPELSGGVVSGARRPDAPTLAPPSKDLPALARPAGPGLPTPLPSPPRGRESDPEPDDFEVDVDDTKAPSEPPRRISHRPPVQLPAICGYGRYEILGRIAFGGMAEIFLGRENSQAGAARLLVIKRILPHVADDPQFVEMFLDEARLAIQLSHPHICHIYEFGELEGTYFIAMEWIHGAPLGKLIRRARDGKALPPEIVVKIFALIAEALHYAHRARDANGQPLGIVHRDVSPHNVMVSYDGQVKLLDFGIAKATSASTKTEAGVVKGKFAYMSPQQCLGKVIDARADVFSLGICLYEALTGQSLYQRPTDYETMKAVIEDPVPSIRTLRPELPQALDAIVKKALAKSPDERWRSADAMQGAMEDWLASTGKAVTTTRIAELMEELFVDEIRRGPLVDSTPFGMSFKRAPSGIIEAARGGTPVSGARAIAAGIAPPADVAPGDSSPPTAVGRGRAKTLEADDASDVLAAAPPARSRTPLYAGLAVLCLLVVGVGAFSLGQLGNEPARETTAPLPTIAAPAIEPPPVVEAPPTIVEPPPPVVVARGRLVVRADAPGANVRVGAAQLTAAEIEGGYALDPGHYAIRVEHPERRPFEVEVDVEAGEEEIVDAHLEARAVVVARAPGRLSINTRPWSRVYVGSRLLGTTPIGEASVPSGTVRLRIVDRDGRTFTRSVTLPPGDERSVFYDLDE